MLYSSAGLGCISERYWSAIRILKRHPRLVFVRVWSRGLPQRVFPLSWRSWALGTLPRQVAQTSITPFAWCAPWNAR